MAAATRMLGAATVVVAALGATPASAQISVGTWQRTDAAGKGITMTVEQCCNGGRRLTYHIPPMGNQPATTLTVASPMDGSDAPALMAGKPTGETMAIKRIDELHYTTTVKMNGQPFATSTTTGTADGKTLTVETTQLSGGQNTKVVETWIKQ